MNDNHDELGGFEQSLLTQLRIEVTTRAATTRRPAPGWSRPRRLALAGAGIAAVAAAGIAVPVLFGGQASAKAYAITEDTDGSISVTIYRFDDAAGLQSQLAAYGMDAVVDYLPAGKMCQQPRFTPATGTTGTLASAAGAGRSDGAFSFTVAPAQFAGHTLVLEYSGSGDADGPMSMQLGLADGAVSACVPVDAPSGGAGLVTGDGPDHGTDTTP